MSSESLISILEEIRDQQKQQIDNFEQAVQTQHQAMELQRRGRRVLLLLIVMPWGLALCLLILLLLNMRTP